MHRLVEAFGGNGTEIVILEEIAEEPPRARRDHHGVRLGNRLQACRKVGGLADNAALLCFAAADQVTDDHRPGAMPMRTCSVSTVALPSDPTAWISARPARTARSASSSCACG